MSINLRGEQEIFRLEVDTTAKATFVEMARWTKFLAIFAFIMMGLALAGSVIAGIILSKFYDNSANTQPLVDGGATASIVVAVIAIIVIAINLYPAYALLKFSTCIKAAVAADDKEEFNRAVRYLKNMFKYFGIMMIVVVCIYALQIGLTMLNLGR